MKLIYNLILILILILIFKLIFKLILKFKPNSIWFGNRFWFWFPSWFWFDFLILSFQDMGGSAEAGYRQCDIGNTLSCHEKKNYKKEGGGLVSWVVDDSGPPQSSYFSMGGLVSCMYTTVANVGGSNVALPNAYSQPLRTHPYLGNLKLKNQIEINLEIKIKTGFQIKLNLVYILKSTWKSKSKSKSNSKMQIKFELDFKIDLNLT